MTLREVRLPEGVKRVFPYIDLWNHNVEFIEQEGNWERPAVFVEFSPIHWITIVPGVEYRAEPEIKFHIVRDWRSCILIPKRIRRRVLEDFVLISPELVHKALSCISGERFMELDLVESQTNHNHEDIVENIEIFQCVAIKRL
ncbi:MAG: hypothetical protein V8Q76_13110 [Bacteroides intestinalis]